MVLQIMSLGQQSRQRELQQESMELVKKLKACEAAADAAECSARVRSELADRARDFAGKIDKSKNGELERKEIGRGYDDALTWFDENNDKKIDIDEYVAGFCDWALTDAAAYAETPKKFYRAHYDMDAKETRAVAQYTEKILAKPAISDDKTAEL